MSDTKPITVAGATPVLTVKNLGKEYKLYDSPRQRVKALLTGRAHHRSHWALRDVSFNLQRGQCIGVVGDNGAGKSSLLKLLAGTMQPTTGTIERSGRITAILELGAGFHGDFTGRENLYFAGSLIGIDQELMRQLEPEIIAFSELQDAIDRPVKTYSSGMNVRLAFALVTAVQPDVLIVDEALAVGDQSFQKKCIERILDFRQKGCTILFCSHSPYHIRHLCDAALWLEKGEVQMIGATEVVLAAYDDRSRQMQAEKDDATLSNTQLPAPVTAEPTPTPAPMSTGGLPSVGAAAIVAVEVAGLPAAAAGEVPVLASKDLVVTITVRGHADESPNIGFMIEQVKGVGITSLGTHEEGVIPRALGGGLWQTTLSFHDLPLHTGDYVISVYLFDKTGLLVYEEWLRFQQLRFIAPKLMPGLVRLPHKWE